MENAMFVCLCLCVYVCEQKSSWQQIISNVFLKFMIRFSSMRLNICIAILNKVANEKKQTNKNIIKHNFVPLNGGFWACTRNEVFVTKKSTCCYELSIEIHFSFVGFQAMCIACDCNIQQFPPIAISKPSFWYDRPISSQWCSVYRYRTHCWI